MDGSVPSWVAIAGTLGGFVAALVADALRDGRALRREREGRAEARRIAREDARDNFERDTLLELQDASHRLIRNSGRANAYEESRFRQSGRWPRGPLPEEIGGDISADVIRDVQRLRVRLLDGALRDLASELISACVHVTLSPTQIEADAEKSAAAHASLRRASDLYVALTEGIGERVRAILSHP